MAFPECIAAALAANEIDDTYAKRARAKYDEKLYEFEGTMPRAEAMAEAARFTHRVLDGEAGETRRRAFMALAWRGDIMERFDGHISHWTGKNDPFLGATGVYDRLLPNRKGLSFEGQYEFWRGQAHATMDNAFAAFKSTFWLGMQGKRVSEEMIVAERFGKATGNAQAKAVADGFGAAATMLHGNFNRFGGHIGWRDDWAMPTSHNQQKINAVPFAEWRDFLMNGSPHGGGMLDLAKMKDRESGELFSDYVPSLGAPVLERALQNMYRGIVTSNWDTREAGSAGGRARANTRAEERFLTFNTPEDWLAYQKRFGNGNVFDAMMRHIDTMSRDIALMQMLSPNPNAGYQFMVSELTRRAALSSNPYDRIRLAKAKYMLKNLHGQATGADNVPANPQVAAFVEDVRNWQTSAMLGMATLISAPSDLNFTRMTLKFNGLPQTKFVAAYAKMLNPADEGDRRLAERLALTAEGAAHVMGREARYIGEVHGHNWSRWLVDRALNVNGLTPHTEANRRAVGWTFQAVLAERAGDDWSALDPAFREALERYRMGEPEWDAIRSTPLYRDRGAAFIRPQDIAERTDLDAGYAFDLAQRVGDWIMTEREFSVPSQSIAGRAIARGGTRPGSVVGTATASVFMFKNFALTYLLSHGRRMIARTTPGQKMKYAASLFVVNTLIGAFVTQMREIAQGRDPRDMTDPAFWGHSVATGGGLGVFGDVLYSGISGAGSSGRNFAETAAGAIAAFPVALFKLAFGGPFMGDVDSGGFPTRLVEFAKEQTPAAKTWWFRTTAERYVFDAIQEEIDPGWKRRVRSIERWYSRQYGNGFWWKRGDQPGLDDSAMRAPDFSTALGGRE